MAIEIEMELPRLQMYDYERNAPMPKCTLVLRYLTCMLYLSIHIPIVVLPYGHQNTVILSLNFSS